MHDLGWNQARLNHYSTSLLLRLFVSCTWFVRFRHSRLGYIGTLGSSWTARHRPTASQPVILPEGSIFHPVRGQTCPPARKLPRRNYSSTDVNR
jgi:hypothetical protein